MLKRNILLGHDAASVLSSHMYRSVFIKISLEARKLLEFLQELLHFFLQYREQFESSKSIAAMLRLKISRDRFYLSPEFSIFRTIEKGVSVTIINIERIDSKNILYPT